MQRGLPRLPDRSMDVFSLSEWKMGVSDALVESPSVSERCTNNLLFYLIVIPLYILPQAQMRDDRS